MGKFMETVSHYRLSGAEWGLSFHGYRVFLRVDAKVMEMVVMVAPHC